VDRCISGFHGRLLVICQRLATVAGSTPSTEPIFVHEARGWIWSAWTIRRSTSSTVLGVVGSLSLNGILHSKRHQEPNAASSGGE
jgi:hypothetical protein